MDLKGKTIVVTGGGSGIGRSLVDRFVALGAKTVIAADIDLVQAQKTVETHGGIAMRVDVSRDEDVRRLIETTETDYGAIDLFCSNAGVAQGLSEQAPDQEWQLCWEVNVISHVYAARHLLPRMIARGGGYFLNTASAAGLLNQVGGE